MTEIGRVEAIFRYPVKSMAGESVQAAELGWHGIEGDRRLALRRTREQTGFPWLSASRLPDLLLFTPIWQERRGDGDLPTHVRTPDGRELEVFGEELALEIERRHKAPVQMVHLRGGIFDEATVSVLTTDTAQEIGSLSGTEPDARRFRPNILLRLSRAAGFQEDSWVGSLLSFGDAGEGPRVSITMRDARCSIVNLDPDTAAPAPGMLRSIVRRNEKNAGVYGTVVRTGRLAVGQVVRLQPALGA